MLVSDKPRVTVRTKPHVFKASSGKWVLGEDVQDHGHVKIYRLIAEADTVRGLQELAGNQPSERIHWFSKRPSWWPGWMM